MGKFLVELKGEDENRSFKLDFKDEETAKQWGAKQAEVWKWTSPRIVVTPIIEAPVPEKKEEEKEVKDEGKRKHGWKKGKDKKE
jgi:hypothetical protein